MRLVSFQVTNFRSVEDNGVVEVGEMTCLVGKNEAGKTALLHALCGLNPHPATPRAFDKERDYPRRSFTDYARRHPGDEAEVIRAIWSLDGEDLAAVADQFGRNAFEVEPAADGKPARTLVAAYRRYEDSATQWDLQLNVAGIFEHLVLAHGLVEDERAPLAEAGTTEELRKLLEGLAEPTRHRSPCSSPSRACPGGP